MDRKKYLGFWCGVFVLLLAICLRVLYIQDSFWYDEACSWFSAKQSFPFGIIDNLLHLDLQHTPLYFFVLHFWMKLFGDSEIAIRCLSLLFGVASIPLLYVVSKKISDNLTAILTTCVAVFAPVFVIFSVEARMYPMAVFFVLLSLNYLIDFEHNGDRKSLIKLILSNILIPYTLVGGILYNLSLLFSYGSYLYKINKDKFNMYKKAVFVELVALIPYFLLIGYYAKMRLLFVVKHEGGFLFAHFVDVIRNFFGLMPTLNIYWPSTDPYPMTLAVMFLIIVPCVYFLYGYIQGIKLSCGFNRVLYWIFSLILIESVLLSMLQVNVFTVRYVLYLLLPMFLLSVIGLGKKLSINHLKIFISLYCLVALFANINHFRGFSHQKHLAFEAVRSYADNLNLGSQDMVILPFGADAAYYFKDSNSPKVLPFDFHKQARNPYNDNFYDKKNQSLMAKQSRYQLIYDAVLSDKGFSDAHFEYFMKNVNSVVPKGNYVLLALYSTDADSLVSIENLRALAQSVDNVRNNCLSVLFTKYLFDIRAYLEYDFNLIKVEAKDNYTYLLYQKR